MSSILDRIIVDKQLEVALRKQLIPIKQLEQSVLFERQSLSLCERLKQSASGLITEHKRRSPSKDCINQNLNVQDVAQGYESAGACGMSVLTDMKYFGGSLEDLLTARASCNMPLLRKEFIIDAYQIVEAKAIGADVILLIAACLTSLELKNYGKLANDLGLEVLYEVHSQGDLDRIGDLDNKIIGINNRNLNTFEVDLEHSIKLADQIPDSSIKVSESGISDPRIITGLKEYGFQGFLIGENFMKTENPGDSCTKFIQSI